MLRFAQFVVVFVFGAVVSRACWKPEPKMYVSDPPMRVNRIAISKQPKDEVTFYRVTQQGTEKELQPPSPNSYRVVLFGENGRHVYELEEIKP